MKSWSDAERILCVRLDSIGDVLMTTPAIRAVRESLPGRKVTLLTSSAGAAAAHLVPEVDDLVVFDAPWMKSGMKSDPSRSPARSIERLVAELKSRQFDGAIIFTVYSQSAFPAAFLCLLAEIPLRLAHCRENPYAMLTDWVKDPEPSTQVRHEVQRQLDLVARVGYVTDRTTLSLRCSGLARERVRQLLSSMPIDPGDRWLVVHPGATAESRRYPPELFAAAARELAEEGFKIILTGDRQEKELVEVIRREMGITSFSLAGGLSFDELVALIDESPLLLSNNTGCVHVAAALGTPVVDIYALTNPQHTPWNVRHRVVFHDVECRYCYQSACPQGHHRCLRMIEPRTVAQAVRDLWGETEAAGRAGVLPTALPPIGGWK